MSDENPPENPDEENSNEEEEEEGEVFQDFGEGKIEEGDIVEFPGEEEKEEEREWGAGGEYGEGAGYYIFRPFAGEAEYPSIWGEREGSVTSEATTEVEETEEEKEARRERELLVENVRQKLMSRMMLRRKNAFLQKKLVEHFKKRRMENVLKEEPKGLDLESKYLKRLFAFKEFKQAQEKEIEDLTALMEQYKNETKVLEEELDEKLKGFMARAKEVSLNLILTKTGKKINEKTIDRLLRRQVQKSEEKGRKKLRYIKVKNLIEEKEQQLKAMEYFGDGLHIVDYEQMKIDNQNYTDKIEEKDDELTKMRLKTQGIIQNLAHIREKSYAIEGDIELMEEKVYEVEQKFIETRERVTQSRKKRDSLREEYTRLKLVSGLLTKDELLRDFEATIFEAKTLSKNLEKMKKLISVKKKQETELARMVQSNIEVFLPLEARIASKIKTN